MKKYLSLVFIALFINAFCFSAYAHANSLEYIARSVNDGILVEVYVEIYTPRNRRPIIVEQRSESTELSAADKLSAKEEAEELHVTVVGEASNRYNCHFYAWAGRDYPGPYWMDGSQVQTYIDDGSYRELQNNEALRAGDIVLYYTSGGNEEHSAVVITPNGLTAGTSWTSTSQPTVRSKWGDGPLCEHPMNVYKNADVVSYVKYYRHYQVHDHTYGEWFSMNAAKHERQCQCGLGEIAPHQFYYAQVNVNYHNKYCGDCEYTVAQAHTWIQSGALYRCDVCMQTSSFIPAEPGSLPPEVLAQLMAVPASEEITVVFIDGVQYALSDGVIYRVVE